MITVSKRNTIAAGLLSLVFAAAPGCIPDAPKRHPVDPNAPVVKLEKLEGYKEAKVVGRSYSPKIEVKKKVNVSTGFLDTYHSHDVPIEFSIPEKYFLFIELENRTFVKEVDNMTFRDYCNNSPIMVKYVEERKKSYRPNVAESQMLSDEFNGLEIMTLEPKKPEPKKENIK